MTERWYYKHEGQTHGPVSADQLAQLASQGKLLAADLVWREGTPTAQAVVAQAILPFPSRPGPVTQVAPAAQDWIKDPRAQASAPPAQPKKAVPDGVPDVDRVVPPAQADGRCRFTVGSASTRGRVRDKNEDSLLVQHWTWAHLDDRHELALLAIADGMGGHGSGEKASALVVRSLAGLLMPALLKVLQGAAGAVTAESLLDELVRALREANRIVHEVATANPACKGMGATVALVLLWESRALISHVGDCRVYHRRGSVLSQVTRDQTLVERMVRLGQLTPEEAAGHPRRNEVDQAVGPRSTVEPSRHVLALQPGDWLVVCCDGLYAHVDEAGLLAALQRAASPPVLAYDLIDLANRGGGSDNCTVISVQCY